MSDKPVFSSQVDVLGADNAVSTNKVLRNTYMLLGMTLAFSAATAGTSMALGLSHMAGLVMMLVGFGLLFVVNRMADTAKGLPAIFAFTGVMGAALGPMLNYYVSLPGGPSMVMQALGGTALVFFSLSAYALNARTSSAFEMDWLGVKTPVPVMAGEKDKRRTHETVVMQTSVHIRAERCKSCLAGAALEMAFGRLRAILSLIVI